jgi:hypothetical protein
MICPKCGFEQPDSPECARCGIFVSRYKGSVPGGAVASAPLSPPPPPPVAASAVGTVYGDPAPAGTVYGGPPAAGGGTVYQGPPAGAQPRRPGAGPAAFGATQSLGMGETLGQSFSIFFKNIIPFLILTAVAFSPVYLFSDYLLRWLAQSNPAAARGAVALTGLVTAMVCIPLTTAMITYGVFQEMRGKNLSLGSCLSVGLSSLLPVISVAFLQLVFFIGSMALILGATVVLATMFLAGGARACGVLLIPLLLFALVFPFMLWLRFFVAVPAAIEERPGALNALRRSAFLTDGQRWRIFGVILVLSVLQFVVLLASLQVPVAGPFLQPLGSLVTTALLATTCAVIYYRLRSFHESIDVDQIASVFA